LITEHTPFEGGVFHLRLQFTPQYPATPPVAHFITKIFHPNIAPRTGEVCVNTLKRDWNSTVTLSEILMVLVLRIGLIIDYQILVDRSKSNICVERGSWQVIARRVPGILLSCKIVHRSPCLETETIGHSSKILAQQS
jgi:Ubiquitin-conjugating enzyme